MLSTDRRSAGPPGPLTPDDRPGTDPGLIWRLHVSAAVSALTGTPTCLPDDLLWTDPNASQDLLAGLMPGEVLVRGPFDHRLLLAQDDEGRWWAGDLAGAPLGSAEWPAWAREGIRLADPGSWWSQAAIDEAALRRLSGPRVLLVSLYHPEVFPLPRFPLAISDLARAARASLQGEVRLMDMQLGVTVDDVLAEVNRWAPDVVGVSATFGQHDVMTDLLDRLAALAPAPLLLAGGSLTARNRAQLARRYPGLLMCRGAGEQPVRDVLDAWHEKRTPEHASRQPASGPHERTSLVDDHAPELDLLPATFLHHGVAQLEASRGCTSACSFCPRGHKGSWSPARAGQVVSTVAAMRRVFDVFPTTSRTIYLVDEEFIGAEHDAEERALAVAATLHRHGMRWESSCRVDQISDPSRDHEWHVRRGRMFRQLHEHGMRRMLFGVESGVDSVLQRFNKGVTADQNTRAIRALTALDVPTRFTYITFDPLMTLDELQRTYDYQGRTDVVLRPRPDLPADEIAALVDDQGFVDENASGRPLYTAVSYMLVSMECLTGSAYTHRATAAGLTGAEDPSMGRVQARYADWRIGRCSLRGQMWVDRNFALDYTLKSLEKILADEERHRVREARVVLKHTAYALLGDMLAELPALPVDEPDPDELDARLERLLDARLEALRPGLDATVRDLLDRLPESPAGLLREQFSRWLRPEPWRLINGPSSCAP